jgi:hypothetical protein
VDFAQAGQPPARIFFSFRSIASLSRQLPVAASCSPVAAVRYSGMGDIASSGHFLYVWRSNSDYVIFVAPRFPETFFLKYR